MAAKKPTPKPAAAMPIKARTNESRASTAARPDTSALDAAAARPAKKKRPG